MDISECNQHNCNAAAAYRFTWPGQDEAGICEEHSQKLRALAQAMGFHIQLIPLDSEARATGQGRD